MLPYNDHVKPMGRSLVTGRFALFAIVSLCLLFGAEVFVVAAMPSEEQPSLQHMVLDYVQGSTEHSSDELLSQILEHPEATLQSIEAAIRDIPQYRKAPVGAQPQRSVLVKGKIASYAFFVPPSYDPAQSYPLIVCLHGAGFTGESYLGRWVPRLEDRYILACPTISMGAWWTRFGENLALAVLAEVAGQYHIDPDRIFLTGMSNGGIGAWIIGMHHADLFAGIAPMASGIDDVLFPFIQNLMNTPVYVIHGEKDRIMPVRLSRDLVQEMKRRGISHHYREHQWTHPHAGGHFFPRQELPDLIAWFDQQRRTSLPSKITVVRDATHLTPLSWVRPDTTEEIAAFTENLIDGRDELISQMVYSKLQAEITDSNTIVVSSKRVKRYTLFLNDQLIDFSRPIVIHTNGRQSFEGIVKPSIKTLLQGARQYPKRDLLFSAKLTLEVPSPQPSQ